MARHLRRFARPGVRAFPTRRAAVLAAAAAALAFLAPGAASAAMTPPSCTVLVAWGQSIDPHDTYHPAPRVALPKAFQEPGFSASFGRPALTWSADDVKSAKHAIDLCYLQARKAGDRKADSALITASKELVGLLPRAIAILDRAKTVAEAAYKEIASLPDSADLASALAILLAADPARPGMNGLRTIPRPIAVPVYHLGQTLPTLADAERETIFKALAARRGGIEAAMTADAEKAIAGAPASAAGVIALLQQRQKLAALSDAGTRARLAATIDQRIAQIGDALRTAKPAVWIPPDCTSLYRWAGEPGANQGVAIGRSFVWKMLTDTHLVPLFGISLGDWTDGDLALFGKLQSACRAEVTALRKEKAHGGTLTEAQSGLVEAASKAGWITDANRDSLFALTRTTLGDYAKATAELQAAEMKIAALPDTTGSLVALKAMSDEPALPKVGEKDFDRFREVFNAKLHAIGARAAKAAIEGLAAIKVANLADLTKFREYAAKTVPTIPDQSGRQDFIAAYDRSMREAAQRLLPQFQAKLDAIPATPEGMMEAHDSVTKLTGIDDHGHAAGLEPLHLAAEKRVDSIIHTMRTEACAGLLSGLGAGNAAKEPLWDGENGVPLGEWICGIAERGAVVSAWSGPGVLSGVSTIKLTLPHGTLETYSLHKGEVLPGKEMLVGFAVKDANQEQKLSVEQWAGFAGAIRSRLPMTTEDCKQHFASVEPGKIGAADKPYWLQCGLEFAGLGDRGR